MEIEVLSWSKYNPRKDLKSMPWFRINSDIGYSETLFGLSAEHKWLWIFILSTCAKNMSGKITGNIDYLSFHSGVKNCEIEKALQVFEKKGLVRITNESVRCANGSTPNRTEQNRTEQNVPDPIRSDKNPSKPDKPVFDFDKIYAMYPRKEGKTPGLRRCKSQIKTSDDYTRLSQAVRNYGESCRNRNLDVKYIKLFSTFMGQWQDFVSMEEVSATESVNFSKIKGIVSSGYRGKISEAPDEYGLREIEKEWILRNNGLRALGSMSNFAFDKLLNS